MLGPFEDRELEPHEYQEVAFHLARCEQCTAELADYTSIGRGLRSLDPELSLDGFKETVMQRIENLPVPLTVRLRRMFGGIGELFPSNMGIAVASAVAAAITVILITPYAQTVMNRAGARQEIARVEHDLQNARSATIENARNEFAREVAQAEDEPEAVISKLESDIPSVAVWNEPRMATTVIWLPDQQ
jgi:anti-sigma factor RsiW